MMPKKDNHLFIFLHLISRWILSRNGNLLLAVALIGFLCILANMTFSNLFLVKSKAQSQLPNIFPYPPHMRIKEPHSAAKTQQQKRFAIFSKIFQQQSKRMNKGNKQSCIHPRLDLKHDSNQFAYESMKPLNCTGRSLFYMQNGSVYLNETVVQSSQIGKCMYYGIERMNDRFYTYAKPVIQESGPFNNSLEFDFLRIRCLLNSTSDEREKMDEEDAQGTDDQDYIELDDRIVKTYQKEKDADDGIRHLSRKMLDSQDYPDANYIENVVENKFDIDDDRTDPFNVFDDIWRGDNFDDGFVNPETDESEFDQFLVQVYPKPSVFQRISKIQSQNSNFFQLNVLMFGLDSMSHLCFQRKLPLTYNLLKNKLDAAIMDGYNIVGDATTAALIPILTGKTEMDLPEVRASVFDSGTVDEYPLVWKKFQQQGYVTLFAEDEPSIATFNLRFNGFQEQPTDHYMRHFWQALWESEIRSSSMKYCTGDVPHHRFMLSYLEDFFIKYHNVSKFAFGFYCELTHWDNNPGEYIDADLSSFLTRLKKKGFLEDSVVIVMSDHGARYSKVRKTVQGKLEERLPMMSFAFPPKFKKKYSNLLNNLMINRKRLVTPFDIHETLLDILNLSRMQSHSLPSALGISLLREIPINRTCRDAGVSMHWCSCLHHIAVETGDEFVTVAADKLVAHINMLTTPHRQKCSEIQLKAIHSSHLVIPNEQVLKYHNSRDADQREANFSNLVDPDVVHYHVQIETEPCSALYEATVVVDFRSPSYKFIVTPGISRINEYGDQPKCIQKNYPSMRKFCCCNNFFSEPLGNLSFKGRLN